MVDRAFGEVAELVHDVLDGGVLIAWAMNSRCAASRMRVRVTLGGERLRAMVASLLCLMLQITIDTDRRYV